MERCGRPVATDEQIVRKQLAAAGLKEDVQVPPPPTLDDGEDPEEGQPLERLGALMGDERPLFEASYRADQSQAVKDLLSVVTARGAQYGSPADDKANLRGALDFGVDPIIGSAIRANDKWIRLKNLVRQRDEDGHIIIQDQAHYAQIRDQFLDISGYSIKCMEMLDELAEQEGWL